MDPMNWVMVLITVCVNFQCEPLIIRKSMYSFYNHYDYEGGMKRPTDHWCRNSLATYHLRDHGAPPSEGIYYLDPTLVGFSGATYDPQAVICWPVVGGPE